MLGVLLPRVFEFNQGPDKPIIPLADPDLKATPEMVKAAYLTMYPMLATCTIIGPEIRDDKKVYTFQLSLGTKA
jgi:PRTRC genetic system protein C